VIRPSIRIQHRSSRWAPLPPRCFRWVLFQAIAPALGRGHPMQRAKLSCRCPRWAPLLPRFSRCELGRHCCYFRGNSYSRVANARSIQCSSFAGGQVPGALCLNPRSTALATGPPMCTRFAGPTFAPRPIRAPPLPRGFRGALETTPALSPRDPVAKLGSFNAYKPSMGPAFTKVFSH